MKKICKHCRKEIDKKATRCPYCHSDLRAWPMRHPILTGIIVIVVIIMVSASGSKSSSSTKSATKNEKSTSAEVSKPAEKSEGVTMEQFSKISEGMTYEEVVSILGSEGEVLSSNEIGGYKTVMYQWKGASMLSNMNATFQNGKMVSKAQLGLK